ncbi:MULTISPECIES: response regulator transcription factor [Sphingobium]|uniref:LuxR family transcriptional regulator n=1 Tax=Sphingobium chungbukense TaxID=56193 RepID=A0A0M3AT50_9SPHN|nr:MULTISPECIES: response regulator [Sphingobium]KKW93372.1 LuxR family transcriptional regulator [Sphingobium chungbukense]PJG47848.1 LuxR family transcriptional regulator [Sphingobium sp. LB126]
MQFWKRDAIRRTEQEEALEAPRTGRRLRLLLIDEDATSRAVVARRLSHLGYDVALAETGFSALGMLVTRPADIILIDMGLTLLPAIATMRKIRAAGLGTSACFVMIGGRQDRVSAVEALEAGADDHVVKPYDFDLLDARLRHLCARAEQMGELTRHNAELDARIARRALELGETRDALAEMQADRARLVSSIQALHDEIARLNAARN